MSLFLGTTMAIFSLTLLLLFVLLVLNPFRYPFQTDLIQIRATFWNILIAPFGKVQFRHFFIADILTSMGQVLKDMGYIVFFFGSGAWR
jgi:hypothetical protein